MADYFLELAKNPLARSIVTRLPLPVSLPPVLKRRDAAWTNEEFSGRTVLFLPATAPETAADPAGRFEQALTETVRRLSGKVLRHLLPEEKANALLLDATRLTSPLALDRVFLALQKNLHLLRTGGRVVIAAAAAGAESESSAMTAALQAFVKSLGRELGRSGGTANLLLFPPGADGEAAEVAAWMLTDRPAFISGQSLQLTHAGGLEIVSDALLKDKTAVVTGAARGIGLAICKTLRREGAKVLGIDHPSQKAVLQEAMQAISADSLIQDLSDPLAPAKLAQLIASGSADSFGQDGAIDIIVHNAGITRDRTLKRMSVAEWDAVMKLNYEFPRQMSLAMLRPQQGKKPLLAKGGRIIMISSIVGLAGNFGQTNYAAAKGGVIGLTEGLATAHPEYRINAIACGFIETGMTAKIPPLMREVARRINALKQGGLPEDVAEACLMLAGPHGSQISGQVVRVCGLHPAGA